MSRRHATNKHQNDGITKLFRSSQRGTAQVLTSSVTALSKADRLVDSCMLCSSKEMHTKNATRHIRAPTTSPALLVRSHTCFKAGLPKQYLFQCTLQYSALLFYLKRIQLPNGDCQIAFAPWLYLLSTVGLGSNPTIFPRRISKLK